MPSLLYSTWFFSFLAPALFAHCVLLSEQGPQPPVYWNCDPIGGLLYLLISTVGTYVQRPGGQGPQEAGGADVAEQRLLLLCSE